MEDNFEDSNCLKAAERKQCAKLMKSITKFIPIPQERRINLILSEPMDVPLNLTLQQSSCKLSCSGLGKEECDSITTNYYWQNVSLPFYFHNCTPLYYYCATFTIGFPACCHTCTDLIFMEGSHMADAETTVEEQGFALGIIVAAVTALALIFVAVGGFIIKTYLGDLKSRGFEVISQSPLNEKSISLQNNKNHPILLLLYIRENNVSFQKSLEDLKLYLLTQGINVVDVYREEEHINVNPHCWADRIMMCDKLKIIILYSDQMGLVLSGSMKVLRTPECVTYYIINSLQNSQYFKNVFEQVFLIRFQEVDTNCDNTLHLGFGLSQIRSYVYPEQRHRFIEDIGLCK